MIKKNEKLFLNNIEVCLKSNGCKTWREVAPDQCKGWSNPYRVDLILYRDDIGYIGIEGKDIHTLGSGGVLAEAVTQIQDKYRYRTYFDGISIKKWGVAVPTIVGYINSQSQTIISRFVQNFLSKMYGISFMTINNNLNVYIDAGTKDSIKFEGDKC